MRSSAHVVPLVVAASMMATALLSSCGNGTQDAPPIAAAGSSADGAADTNVDATPDTSAEGAPGDGQAGHDGNPDGADAVEAYDAQSETADGAKDGETAVDAQTDGSTDVVTDATSDAAVASNCLGDPPAGSPEPLAWPVYPGTCPTLAPAPATNTIQSSGSSREFRVALPVAMTPAERLPVVFVWHWLGGDPNDAYSTLEIQAAVELHRFIAVIPTSKGDLLLRWPFSIVDSQGRMNEEFQFFDDMLACVVAAVPNATRHCVSSVGVSAGALFTDQLASARADRLASFVSISGGVGTTARSWGKPAHKLPGIVLWGGLNDDYQGLYDFNKGSLDVEDSLVKEGNFFIECIHNCGHAVPPFEAPPGGTRFDAVWQFVFDHPYWLGTGASPYKAGLPGIFPSWCGPGKGSAVPRPDGSPC